MKKLCLEKQEVCHICKKEFCFDENEKNEFELYHKVRDHCNYTGKFRGAARNICNLRYKVPKEMPVVTHNAEMPVVTHNAEMPVVTHNAAYDDHFKTKQLAK